MKHSRSPSFSTINLILDESAQIWGQVSQNNTFSLLSWPWPPFLRHKELEVRKLWPQLAMNVDSTETMGSQQEAVTKSFVAYRVSQFSKPVCAQAGNVLELKSYCN